MVLNPGKSHFMLFGAKENEQFNMICNVIKVKDSSHEKILNGTTDNKLSFDEHIINIRKAAKKNSTVLVE